MSEPKKNRGGHLRLWIGLMVVAVFAGLGLAARSLMPQARTDGERLQFDTAPLLSVQLGDEDAALPANIEIIHAEYANGDRSIGYRLDLTARPPQGQTGCTGRLETLLSASQAEIIRGILLAGYPGSTLEQLRKRLSQPALGEGDAIIATQLAIWQARYGLEFQRTEKLSTAARAMLLHLAQAKPAQASPWALDCDPAALIVSKPAQVTGPIRVANRKSAGGQLDLMLDSRQSVYFALPKADDGADSYVRGGDALEGVRAGEYYLQLPRNGDGRLNLWVRAKDRLPVREDFGYIDADLGRLAIWANEGLMAPSMCVQVSWGEVSAPTAEVLANPIPVNPPTASGSALGTPIDPNTGAAAGGANAGPSGTVGGSGIAADSTAMPGIPILTPPPGIPIPDPNGTQVPTSPQAHGETPSAPPGSSATNAAAKRPSMAPAPVRTGHRTPSAPVLQTAELSEDPPSPTEIPGKITILPEVEAIVAPGHLRLRYLSNALIVQRRESITVESTWEDPDGETELPAAAILDWSSSDPAVASLYVNDGLCTIEARGLGACVITLSVRGRPDVFTQIQLTVAEPMRETSENAAQTLRLRAPGFSGADVRFETEE